MVLTHPLTSGLDRPNGKRIRNNLIAAKCATCPPASLWTTTAFAQLRTRALPFPESYSHLSGPQLIECVSMVPPMLCHPLPCLATLLPLEVWMADFQDRLRVRASSHHARCSICVRHRLIVKKLPAGPARQAQLIQYKRHLTRQYRDRQVYWGHRSASRTNATSGAPITEVSVILDGMDQAKHAYPKSASMASKEFNSWSRPRLAATTLIAHGHAIVVGLSPDNVPCAGSRTMELVAYLLTKPLNYVDWRATFLFLEADNCTKELKHQTSLRMLATMVGQYRLRGVQLSYLATGHSHEDIDAHFSVTSAWLDRFPELWCVEDFQQCLASMLANKQVRVNEPKREVILFDRYRDWNLDCISPAQPKPSTPNRLTGFKMVCWVPTIVLSPLCAKLPNSI